VPQLHCRSASNGSGRAMSKSVNNRPRANKVATKQRQPKVHSQSEPMNQAPEPARPLMIVGIGASAGGLSAFKAFFAEMPTDSGIGFVLVQHLDPTHKSILSELVGRQTRMPVVDAEDGMPVAADRVHIIPPDATLTIAQGILHVDRPAPPRQRRFPIDAFFTSLAEDQAENAVGIVLSGTGSDGTLGIKMIKQQGGLTLAQSEHDHLAMTGMPESAVATGLVDRVMQVEEMPARLIEYQQYRIATAGEDRSRPAHHVTEQQLVTITSLLRSALGHDFANYNENTLDRRIQRRMQALRIGEVAAYIRHLRKHPHEFEPLFRELLISVTEFFRDPAAFEMLETDVLPTLLAGKTDADQVRVWVPGCATGEEVYSIAILIKEEMDRRAINTKVQIFGTDIDQDAVAIARTGRYTKPKGSLSAERLRRWLVSESDGYRVLGQIREMCVFSLHSVVKDPPFSKLDLVSCRNLLIYLNPELQERVARTFHYALRPGGVLFLGPAEGVSRSTPLFEAIDAKSRLFRRRDTAAVTRFQHFRSAEELPPSVERPATRPPARLDDWIERSAQSVLEKHSPAYMVVNRQNEVIRFSGGEIGRYLEPSAGVATLSLFGILRRSLRPAVRAALETANAARQAVVHKRVRIKLDDQTRAVTVIVEPIAGEGNDPGLCVVAFKDVDSIVGYPKTKHPSDSRDAGVQALEDELSRTKEQLLAAVDAVQGANDETKSSAEEYQSVNEELQSSNEELETAKEEMQSVNEELQTVNAELSSKNDLLTHLNSDIKNLLDSTQIPTVFLDNAMRVKGFTPAITSVFHLRDTDRGRPITEIATTLTYDGLPNEFAKVLRELSVVEREVQMAEAGLIFIMRIRPYYTVDRLVDGVVITFMDITERRRTEEAFAIVEFAQDAAISISLDGIVRSWNPGAERLFGTAAQKAIGQPIAALIEFDPTAQRASPIAKAMKGELPGQIEIAVRRPNGADVAVEVVAVPIRDADDAIIAVAVTARDISERKRAEARSTLLLNELNHRVKNTLANVQSLALETLRTAPTPEAFQEAFMARLIALSSAHNVLVEHGWRDAALNDVIEVELEPYLSVGHKRWTVTGPNIRLTPKMALALGMAFHELATNAAKFGALSAPEGHIDIDWSTRDAGRGCRLHLSWVERGGPAVETPVRKGFGRRLIDEGLAYELDGEVQVDYLPAGVRCIVDVPMDPAEEPP
jgi:two-component system CheB/CheR fusion protein